MVPDTIIIVLGALPLLYFLISTCSHKIRIPNPTIAITVAPGEMFSKALKISENVVSPSTCENEKSPSGSASYPKKCGICFRIMIIPIPESIPLMTEEGK